MWVRVLMIRAKVWFRCAAMLDPVQPILLQPAKIGWRGRFRNVDLTIERVFNGEELTRRMKDWVTVDTRMFCMVVQSYGWLKVFDDGGLVVEVEDDTQFQALKGTLADEFQEQVELEILER